MNQQKAGVGTYSIRHLHIGIRLSVRLAHIFIPNHATTGTACWSGNLCVIDLVDPNVLQMASENLFTFLSDAAKNIQIRKLSSKPTTSSKANNWVINE